MVVVEFECSVRIGGGTLKVEGIIFVSVAIDVGKKWKIVGRKEFKYRCCERIV